MTTEIIIKNCGKYPQKMIVPEGKILQPGETYTTSVRVLRANEPWIRGSVLSVTTHFPPDKKARKVKASATSPVEITEH